jgi:hypothetical protein
MHPLIIDLDARIIANPAVVGQVLEHETVLLLPEQSAVKVLNDVGTQIWTRLDGLHTIRQIVDSICTDYAVEQTQAQADTLAFVRELVQRDLARVHED